MDAIDNILGQHLNDVALCFYQNGIRGPITRQRLIEVLCGPQGEQITNELYYRTQPASYVDDTGMADARKKQFTQDVLKVLYAAMGLEVPKDNELTAAELKKQRERELFKTFVVITLLLGIVYALTKS